MWSRHASVQWREHARLARWWHARWWDGGLHAWVAGMLVVMLLRLMMLLLLLRVLMLWLLLGVLLLLLLLLLRMLAVWIHVGAGVVAVRAKVRFLLQGLGNAVGISVGRPLRRMLMLLVEVVRGRVNLRGLHVDGVAAGRR